MPALIYALAFIGGFVIMSIEMLGGRLLAPYFGSSIFVIEAPIEQTSIVVP